MRFPVLTLLLIACTSPPVENDGVYDLAWSHVAGPAQLAPEVIDDDLLVIAGHDAWVLGTACDCQVRLYVDEVDGALVVSGLHADLRLARDGGDMYGRASWPGEQVWDVAALRR